MPDHVEPEPVQGGEGLERRVARLIGDACDDAIETGVLGDAECAAAVIALVRDQVAREIEAGIEPNHTGAPPGGCHICTKNNALRVAARIARGSVPEGGTR